MKNLIPLAVILSIIGAVVFITSQRADALDVRVVRPQTCQVACTADGGTPANLYDCVDGGTLWASDSVKVRNASSTAVHVGARSARGPGRAVSVVNDVAEVCDGCDDGKVWSADMSLADLGCTSEGAAVNITVTGASK